MFSEIWNKIKEIVSKMLPKKSIENVIHVTPCVSDRMADAIQLWSDMYEGNSPWLKEPTDADPVRIVSLGLPALIASEKARMVTLEMKSEINAPMVEITVGGEPFEGQDPEQFQNPEETDSTKSNLGTAEGNAVGSAKENDGVTPGGITMSSAFKQRYVKQPKGPTERADFLNKQYKKLKRQIRRQLEYGIAKGGIVIKPYIVLYDNKKTENTETAQDAQKTSSFTSDSKNSNSAKMNVDNNKTVNTDSAKTSTNGTLQYDGNLDKAEIEFDFVQADRFFPLAFDANGKVIEAAFIQTKVNKAMERVYIRLEYHKLENRTLTVQNMAFESTDMGLANSNNIKTATNLGRAIPLTAVPEWATMQPTTVIEGVDRLLFAYFRMPEANTVDPYSPLGVSGYSRVVNLIKDADMQYSRLLWEFEGGEMAIDVDRNALMVDGDKTIVPQKQQRLFRKVDLNSEDTYNVFAPALRDVSITNGLNTIFMRIEDACGLSRGTLSEVTQQEAKTATELKILKQRSYATNADIQMALQDALEDAVYVMDVYCDLYDVTPAGEYETSFEWDDSIIVDSESELSKRITLMQNGLASRLETRMWYFGETENQARLALQQVDKEATESMRQKAEAQIMTGQNLRSDSDPTQPVSDTTSQKISQGKQADDLDNPNKSKTDDAVKNNQKK